jgi:ribonuclease P protein component
MRRHPEFAATIRAGRRAGRGKLVAHLALETPVSSEPTRAGTSLSPALVGFVVPKAVGSAVARNLVRRRLRHLLRERLDTLPAGSALVVRVLPGAAEASQARLAQQLDAVLEAVKAGRDRAVER